MQKFSAKTAGENKFGTEISLDDVHSRQCLFTNVTGPKKNE